MMPPDRRWSPCPPQALAFPGASQREGAEVGIPIPAGTELHVNGDDDHLGPADRLPEDHAEIASRFDAAPALDPAGLLQLAQVPEAGLAGEPIRTRQGSPKRAASSTTRGVSMSPPCYASPGR